MNPPLTAMERIEALERVVVELRAELAALKATPQPAALLQPTRREQRRH